MSKRPPTQLKACETKKAPPAADADTRWYLGFDCATKTLGFGLVGIRLEHYRENRARLWQSLQLLLRGKLTKDQAAGLDRETASLVQIADGEVTDLFPGRPDKSIHTIERLCALGDYVDARVLPAIAPHAAALSVPIEYQMGPNAPARAIAASLITLFRKHRTFIVGPSLKNKVWFTEEGKYCYFVQKYKSLYPANKAHAKFNFEHLERVFGTDIPATKPASLRGHIADAVMQVFGHIMYWDEAIDPTKAF